MKMLNDSFPTAGLTCSMQDHQLSEYLQIRNTSRLPEKLAVRIVGQQDRNIWVFGPNCHINSDGILVNLVHMFGYLICTLDLELHHIRVRATLCSP